MRSSLITAALLTCLNSCSNNDLGFVTPDSDLFVVQAYLYAGERVADVTVTGVLPVDADSGETAPPISDASVVLVRGAERFTLVPMAGKPGRYEYAGNDLTVGSGDEFTLEVTVGSRTATAATIVPVAPVGLDLSLDTVVVDTTFPGPGPGTGVIDIPQNGGTVIRWLNAEDRYHFVVTENVDDDPTAIPGPGGATLVFRRVSQPTTADSAVVRGRLLGYYGRYRVKLYRVRDEYVDLYRGRRQDSRDLNEPPTNVRGALGIFAAFASDSAFFIVR